MITELRNTLDKILEDIDESNPLFTSINTCVNLAYELDIIEVHCARCDRPFRSLPDTKYCTKECELGGVPMPYQTREQQAKERA